MTKKPWTPDKIGMVECEHTDWPKANQTIPLGKYTLFPCMICWRQIQAAVLLELLKPEFIK